MLKSENISNRKLYREIFLKTQEEFINLVNGFKESFSCKDCRACCELMYAEKNPQEIVKLLQSDEKDSHFWQALKTSFVPFGYDKNYDWSDPQIDIELNHLEASKINEEYVKKVKMFNENAIFYCYRSMGDSDCSINEGRSFSDCIGYPYKLLTVLHKSCVYNQWQEKVESFLKKELSHQIYSKINKIEEYRDKFTCNRTGTCCKLSSSEHNYEQLQEKAKSGDKFAQEFISIFKPYKTLEEAREVFPEYVDYVLSEFDPEETINFYYCPHLDENNLCMQYEKRPSICRDFPSNPLAIMFPGCGYIQWKKETIVTAFTSHAMIEICMFTLEKLLGIKND